MQALDDFADAALLAAAAREAGALLRTHFGSKLKSWDKGGTPVSEADLAADKLLHERLMGARPLYGWLSEETRDDPARLSREAVFVVDPLDGTVAFLKGREDFSVSLAVVRNGAPSAAAVYAPMSDTLFLAALGHGAARNGVPINVSAAAAVEGCRMIGPRDMFAHPAWPQPWPEMDIRRIGSIALRLALVAAGEADATLALSTKSDWDLAAGDLIAREAGARVTAHDGAAFVYNQSSTLKPSLLAAGPALYPLLSDRVGAIKLRSSTQA